MATAGELAGAWSLPRNELSLAAADARNTIEAEAACIPGGTVASTKLALYRAKRDFTRTAEPSGRSKVARSARLRFVVQKHAATRLHYDLRLELDGVFKSWAVTKAPSLDPAVKRLAVEVEDHPLDYGDFEGTIPQGEYGGGTVQLWDRGYWQPEGAAAAADMLSRGSLRFRLEGKHLKGGWVLVRMRRDPSKGKRNNWLLIKHRDEFSSNADTADMSAADRSVASGRAMTQIAAGTGRKPRPFMLGAARIKANAVWNSDRNEKSPERARDTRSVAAVRRPKAARSMPENVTLTNPDKIMWPKAGRASALTKRDLADYYAAIAPWMIDHIRGRPCSIIRAPDGIGGERFFQRHAMQGTSPLLTLVKVAGDRKPYLQVDRLEALVALAQVAALEIHPWNCIPGNPELPGRFVFDLDPAPDVAFAAVVAAAVELRQRLTDLGLISFCKTTGAKGLHVVTPFSLTKTDRIGWPEAKALAREICTRMAADSPQKYLTTMTKSARVGRIFLDYLRNDRMATAVAPLSPRARPGAPVSMPLRWTQVRADLDPSRYTLSNAAGLVAKAKAWEEYGRATRPLLTALKRIVGSGAAKPRARRH